MEKKIFPILLTSILSVTAVIVLALILFFGFVVFKLNPNPVTAPVYFTLNDPIAYYSIKKTDNTDSNYPNYFVVHDTDEVFVGTSQVELDPFVGKKIAIQGNYSGRIGNEQCIVNKCHSLSGKSAMIDIDSIQEVR